MVSRCGSLQDRQELARKIIAYGDLAVPVPQHVFDALYRDLNADGLRSSGT
jgi:hypothetical protein